MSSPTLYNNCNRCDGVRRAFDNACEVIKIHDERSRKERERILTMYSRIYRFVWVVAFASGVLAHDGIVSAAKYVMSAPARLEGLRAITEEKKP